MKRAVPLGHALYARELAEALACPEDVKRVLEWHGEGTFHGKGVWLKASTRAVDATLLGSSNWNVRSRDRDLELGGVLLTSDRALQRDLADEWQALAAPAAPRRDDLSASASAVAPVLRPVLRPYL